MEFFLDLSKAYDSLNHNILYTKLERLGIRGKALGWIESYLTDRLQRVTVKKDGVTAFSSVEKIRVGIPQGSILGPALFVLYLNDLSTSVNETNLQFDVINYADDTSLVIPGSDFSELSGKTNIIYRHISQWFNGNNFILNEDKTNIILFKTRNAGSAVGSNIDLCGKTQQLGSFCKFLGLYVDDSLNWKHHIDYLCGKLGSVVFGIRTVAKYMNLDALRILYFSNFESLARYAIIFWGCSPELQRIFVIQKRTVRIMCKMKCKESCQGIFKRLNLMTVYGLYIFECLIFMFRNKCLFPKEITHDYNTRMTDMYYPYHRLALTENFPHYMCIKLYNKLPENIKQTQQENRFKKHVKNMIVDLEPYNLSDYYTKDFIP